MEEFQCPICLGTLENPHVDQCGHSYCHVCINEWLKDRQTCPVSKLSFNERVVFPNLIVKMLLSDSFPGCINNKKGCSWRGKKKLFDGWHRTKCVFGLFEEGFMETVIYNFGENNPTIKGVKTDKGHVLSLDLGNENNQIGVYKYADGSIYEGYMKEFLKHGPGRFTKDSGNTKIEGNFANDVPEGYCVVYEKKSMTYDGNFENGKRSGDGIVYIQDAMITGTLKDEQFVGPVKMRLRGKEKYAGEIMDGKPNGQGTYTVRNGDNASGQFIDGKLSGKIIINYPVIGSTFEGEGTFPGVLNGNGKMMYKNNEIYEGNFVNGLKEGKAVFTMADSTIYETEYVKDQMNGPTKVFRSNGRIIEMTLQNNSVIGIAKSKFPNGMTIESPFILPDKHCGVGKITMPDGLIIEGNIMNDMIYGKGTIKNKDGDVYTGEIKNNVMMNGKVSVIYANGGVFEGSIVNGKRSRKGILKVPNVGTYTGDFVDDNLNGIVELKNGKNPVKKIKFKKGVEVKPPEPKEIKPKKDDLASKKDNLQVNKNNSAVKLEVKQSGSKKDNLKVNKNKSEVKIIADKAQTPRKKTENNDRSLIIQLPKDNIGSARPVTANNNKNQTSMKEIPPTKLGHQKDKKPISIKSPIADKKEMKPKKLDAVVESEPKQKSIRLEVPKYKSKQIDNVVIVKVDRNETNKSVASVEVENEGSKNEIEQNSETKTPKQELNEISEVNQDEIEEAKRSNNEIEMNQPQVNEEISELKPHHKQTEEQECGVEAHEDAPSVTMNALETGEAQNQIKSETIVTNLESNQNNTNYDTNEHN